MRESAKEYLMGQEIVQLVMPTPRGEIGSKRFYPLASRSADLTGKRIAMVHNKKAGADTFLVAIEGLLKQRFSGLTFLRQYTTEINLARDPSFYDEIARSSDAFIFGSGD
jgi:hypothetical protein